MGAMTYNKSPISMKEGKIFIDGQEVADGVECKITFTPETASAKFLGNKGRSTRWLGYTIKALVVRGRTNAFLKDMVTKYKESRITPEYTIQGIMDDPGSDYVVDGNGPLVVTAVGCVPTGDIDLMHSNTDSNDFLKDTINFEVYDVEF